MHPSIPGLVAALIGDVFYQTICWRTTATTPGARR
jgi:hypothetical protein